MSIMNACVVLRRRRRARGARAAARLPRTRARKICTNPGELHTDTHILYTNVTRILLLTLLRPFLSLLLDSEPTKCFHV